MAYPLRYGVVFKKDNLYYLTSSATFRNPIVEGEFNTYTSLGVITLDYAASHDYGFMVDCTYEILYAVYATGYPSWSTRLATYQLPELTKYMDVDR